MPVFIFFNIISSQFSGFYTGWLFPAAVVGVLVFLYGVLTMNSNTIAVETCQHGDQYLMCPLCETCDYWKLKDICAYKRIAYLFDHPGTVFYAIFMSFWGKNSLEKSKFWILNLEVCTHCAQCSHKGVNTSIWPELVILTNFLGQVGWVEHN